MTSPLHIGLTSVDGRYHGEAVFPLLGLGRPLLVDSVRGTLLPQQRDTLCARFLEQSASHLLMIDQDIVWQPGHVSMLLDLDAPIAFGMYPKRDGSGQASFSHEVNREPWGPCERVRYRHCGAGFLLLRRDVVERMTEHFRPTLGYTTQGGEDRVGLWMIKVVQDAEGVSRMESEDFAFCRRWNTLSGYDAPPVTRTDIVLGHIGQHVYTMPTVTR